LIYLISRLLLMLLFATTLFSVSNLMSAQVPPAALAAAREYIPGRIAFKLRPGAAPAEFAGLAQPSSLHALFLPVPAHKQDTVGLARWFALDVAPGAEDSVVAFLRSSPAIELAERVNTGIAIASAPPQPPNDPGYPGQWCLNQGNDIDMDVPEAWTLRGTYESDPTLLIGDVDTGYDSHFAGPEFANAIWTNPLETQNGLDDDGNGLVDDLHGWDFVNNDNDPYSDHTHGTETASVIAARTDNATSMAGIASGVRIVPAKAFNSGGGYPCCGPWAGATSAAVSLQYCVDNGSALINNSWTNGASPSQVQQDAVQYALDNGVVVVFAAGNANTTNAWPPMTDGVIAVAAIDSSGVRSNWGFGQASNYGPWVELSAGGSGVTVMSTNGVQTTADGTSFACPNVVGVGALVLSQDRDLSSDDLLAVLQEGSVSIDALNPGFAGQLGSGHVNAFYSLRLLKPVADLGGAFGGAQKPVLNGWGSFGLGKQFSLSVSRARVSSAGAFAIGFSTANLPLFGGVLVPSPDVVLPFVTSAKGASKQQFVFASALPPGAQVHAQAAVLDATAPQGVALTNALKLSVP
jgi:hypothetical protein